MEVRDPVHGSINILDIERPILEHPFFQRLRSIKQLGFSEYVFPGATHTRYLHSIGVMEVANRVFDGLFRHLRDSADLRRLKESLRLACLLHDIGHAPLSHTTESVMPPVKELKLPKKFAVSANRKATHEDYTIKAIVDSDFTSSFAQCETEFGVDPTRIADLITGKTDEDAYFTINGINYFPLLNQLVSSEMDCDRMDYLLRDSYFCGVSYGKFDLDWIIDNLRIAKVGKLAYLGINERAVATFDDFLLSRFHMFLMVYFHYKPVCLEKMLKRYFVSSQEYSIPADIGEYLHHDDHFLMNVLRSSGNVWAQRIVSNRIPAKIFETFGNSQKLQLDRLENFLRSEDIDYIKCSSSGRISKYYDLNDIEEGESAIRVVRESALSPGENENIRNIEEATDLFEKFSQAHSVNRIHLDFNELAAPKQREISKIIQC